MAEGIKREVNMNERVPAVYPSSNPDDDATLKLIEKVKSYRCLWDYNDPESRDSVKTKEAWKDVAQTFGSKPDQARLRWMRLRKKYMNFKYKYGSYAVPLTSFPLVEHMHFLREGFKKKKLQRRCVAPPVIPDRKRSEEHDSGIDMHQNGADGVVPGIDSDYLFLISLLPALKKLSDVANMRLRMRIQKVIFDELCGGTEDDTPVQEEGVHDENGDTGSVQELELINGNGTVNLEEDTNKSSDLELMEN